MPNNSAFAYRNPIAPTAEHASAVVGFNALLLETETIHEDSLFTADFYVIYWYMKANNSQR